MEVILLIATATLLILLELERRSYSKFIEKSDAIIHNLLDMERVVNSNADVQEKMKNALLSFNQDIDTIEKVLGIHSQALKLIGPVIPKPDDLGFDPIAKV